MKIYLIPVVMLLVCAMVHAQYSGHIEGSIEVNCSKNTLSAPSACSFQWYYNGMKLSLNTREIEVISSGTYKVEMIGVHGEMETASITVGFSDDGELYTIYILGDSTAANWSSGYYPQTGWGQVFKYFFSPKVMIDNRALSARSAKSFYNDHWAEIKNLLKPGDFVFIQFGINDSKSDDTARYSEPFTTFQDYLTLFIKETQARGAHPVLLTTVRRNRWNTTEPPTLYPSYHDYPVATRQLAGELDVPLIDLDQLAVPLMEGLGPEYTGPFMYLALDSGEYATYPTGKADEVHFQEMGAIDMARLVAETISGFSDDTVMNRLIPYIKPVYEVAVSTNFPEGAIITRTAGYPEGTPVTIKAKVDPDFDLLEWRDDKDSLISKENRFTFIMGNKSMSYTAILDDDPVPDCSGEYNGTAYLDDCGDCVEGTTGLMPCYIELQEDTFRIVSVSTGLCVQEAKLPDEDDTFIGLTSWSGDREQAWIFSREEDRYSIRNLGSDLYLNSDGNTISSFLLASEQLKYWRIEECNEDTFQFIPEENTRLVADIYSNSQEDGYFLWLLNRRNSPAQKFTIRKVSGIALDKNQIEVDGFVLYPNPVKNEFYIIPGEKSRTFFSLFLYDISGKQVVKYEKTYGGKFTLKEGLTNGFYVMKIMQEDRVCSYGFIKL